MRSLRVGLTCNLKRSGGEDEAEFDTPETLDSIVRAIEAHGHKVIPWEATRELVRVADPRAVDSVFIAEAAGLSHAGLMGAIQDNALARNGIS